MTRASYVLEVDWEGDGLFAGAYDNITNDFFSIECRRGRDYASQLTGRATAGKLVALLKNIEGKYSSFNSTSPIYSKTLPGRKIRLRTTAPAIATLWTGFLNKIIPGANIAGIPTAELEAVGPIEKIKGKRVNPPGLTNTLTGIIVDAVLDDVAWPGGDRDIDTGQTTLLHWFAFNKDALDAIRDVEETEMGFFYEAEDAKVVYEDRHHRLKGDALVSQATFADDGTGDCGFRSIEQQDPLREIFNEVFVVVEPHVLVTPAEVLWTFREANPTIGPGQSVAYWTEYPNVEVDSGNGAYVSEWVTPVVGTDIVQSGAAYTTPLEDVLGGNYVSYLGIIYLVLTGGNRRVMDLAASAADVWSANPDWPTTTEITGGIWTDALRAVGTIYWTASEYDANNAWRINANGTFAFALKTTSYAARLCKTLPEGLFVQSGSGTEAEPYILSSLTVSAAKFANAMKISITNNDTVSTATLTLIQARGEPVRRRESIRVNEEDAASKNDYGTRTYRLPGPWLPDTNTARDFTQYVLSRYKDPLPVVRMLFKAIKNNAHMIQALTRKISDRITVRAQTPHFPFGIDTDFFIEAIGHRITAAGSVHEVFYDLSDAIGDSGYWVLGVSELGSATKLAY